MAHVHWLTSLLTIFSNMFDTYFLFNVISKQNYKRPIKVHESQHESMVDY